MSHATLIRQRIKAVQVIQKTTSAMRLIAMSLQGRLRKRNAVCSAYHAAISAVRTAYAEQHHVPTHQKDEDALPTAPNPYVIIIASHKGLCGTFNEQLFDYVQAQNSSLSKEKIITIGTHAQRFIHEHGQTPVAAFDILSITTFATIAQQVTRLLIQQKASSITIYSHFPQTFFFQQPRTTEHAIMAASDDSSAADQLHHYLTQLELQSTIISACYNSLLAEQAARFLSMDNATRNADDLLVRMRLEYNKTRQSLVTRELIELSSGLIAQD